jgi:AAA+ ATPase superfamily predicted ATPase
VKKPFLKQETFRELQELLAAKSKTASFCYLRGRRRVGKSTLLLALQKQSPQSVFYFMGRLDESTLKTKVRLAQELDEFFENKALANLKTSALSWDVFFKHLINLLSTRIAPLLIAFDEIQWIAREGNGFLGALKQYWIELEKFSHLKIVLCGSSNKFFQQNTGGEEKLIRGLKTRSDIWLLPMTLSEIKKHWKPNFSKQHLVLLYFTIGGIPYYWNQVKSEHGILNCLNELFFLPKSIFLEEHLEMLHLEFQKNSSKTISKLLMHIGIAGLSEATIVKKSGFPLSTIHDLLSKLEEYGIVFRKAAAFAAPKEVQRGSLFYMNDFFLNFYFCVLVKNKSRIERNRSELLLAERIFEGSTNLYIPNFSGGAFENFVRNMLETSESRSEGIFQKLNLKNRSFEVGFHWDKNVQFDLVVYNCSDKMVRFLECKWTDDVEQIKTAILSFHEKTKHFEFEKMHVVCVHHEPSQFIRELASKNAVVLVGLDDYFDLAMANME